MKINPKSEKGAITLVVLIGMLFLTAFLMSMYIQIANRAQSSAETTKQISEQYNNLDEANAIYDSYFSNTDVIPIYTKEQLEKIGSGEQVLINGKVYTFSTDGYYTIQNDLDLGGVYNENTGTWSGTQWTPLTSNFIGTLDGLGHTISGMYINNPEQTNQGLFGTLKGTVKNLNLRDGYINGLSNIAAIAGTNSGTIINCNDNQIILEISTDNGKVQVDGVWYNSLQDYINGIPIENEAELITFYINDTEYKAVQGCTWYDWVESKYNVDGYYKGTSMGESIIFFPENSSYSNYVVGSSMLSFVTGDELIIEGKNYVNTLI